MESTIELTICINQVNTEKQIIKIVQDGNDKSALKVLEATCFCSLYLLNDLFPSGSTGGRIPPVDHRFGLQSEYVVTWRHSCICNFKKNFEKHQGKIYRVYMRSMDISYN